MEMSYAKVGMKVVDTMYPDSVGLIVSVSDGLVKAVFDDPYENHSYHEFDICYLGEVL